MGRPLQWVRVALLDGVQAGLSVVGGSGMQLQLSHTNTPTVACRLLLLLVLDSLFDRCHWGALRLGDTRQQAQVCVSGCCRWQLFVCSLLTAVLMHCP